MSIDIGTPLHEICRRLELDPANVRRLELYPRSAVAVIYLRNENGAKYIGDDDGPATETRTFEVTT